MRRRGLFCEMPQEIKMRDVDDEFMRAMRDEFRYIR